ncbi:MAG TPA: sugar ABC transporter permease [Candidatus Limnocylindrales bacterium]|nr:sugar ABC transporter permease [Candidatus Limnocylindrales bacterium]
MAANPRVEAVAQARGRSRLAPGEGRLGWLMAGPAILLLIGFLVLPFILAFGLAFTNQRLISPNPTEFVGTRNFEGLLTVKVLSLEPERNEAGGTVIGEDGAPVYPALRDITRDRASQYYQLQEWLLFDVGGTRHYVLVGDAVFMKSLVNTIAFALVIVPLQSAFGLLLALLVNRRMRVVNLFRTIYFLPVVTSMVVISLLWKFLYSPDNGLVNEFLGAATFGAIGPVNWLGDPATALPAIMVMSMWQAVGFHMVIWLSGLQTIPSHLYEAAALDGAGRWAQFRNVTWPGLRNTSVFILITITIAAFGLFTQIDVMTKGGPLDSTSTVIFQAVQRGFGQQDIAYGSAISVVFFVMVLSVALIQRYLTREA